MPNEFPYTYEFPLPEVKGAPVPSQANYKDQNCAWLIEMFAGIINRDKSELIFRYENNTPNDKDDDIFVRHPQDRLYYDEAARRGQEGSPEMERYNMFAKKSQRLLEYMETSPANIDYFKSSAPSA